MPILTAAHEKTNGCQYRDQHSIKIQRQPSGGLASYVQQGNSGCE